MKFTKRPFLQTSALATALVLTAHSSTANTLEASAPAEPEKYALMIGIDKYPVRPLSGCKNDTLAIKTLLTKQFSFNPDEQHIKTLFDEEATKKAIMDAFRSQLIANAKKLKEAGKDGIFVFQYSGHGSQVKDLNGDETDGRDETLCPVDVSLKNGNSDLIDDEMEELVSELNRYTDNVTLLIDCCHSGTNTRALGFTPRRLDRPELFVGETKSRSGEDKVADKLILPPNKRYVALAGCMPDELSLETQVTSGETHGLMTYGLLKALETGRKDMTYRDLWSSITSAVNSITNSQNPQIEGDLDRVIFKGAAQRTEPSFRVTNAKGTEVEINAGTILGVKKGGVVAFYRPEATVLSGEENKITTGDVIEAGNYSATVKLTDDPSNIDIKTAKVIPVTPFFGKGKLFVALQDSTKNGAGSGASSLLAKLKTDLPKQEAFSVKLANSDPLNQSVKDWQVAIVQRKGSDFVKFGGTFALKDEELKNKDGFFIASKDGYPLYNLFVPADTKNGDKALVKALENRNRQEALRSFSNNCSALGDSINVQIERVTSKPPAPGTKVQYTFAAPDTTSDNLTIPTFKIGDKFRLAISNKSEHPLYVSGLCVGADGSIQVAFPPRGAVEKVEPGNKPYYTHVLNVGGPLGAETLQLIVTSAPVDYSTLEQAPASAEVLRRDSARGENNCDGVRNMLLQSMYLPQDKSRTLSSDAPSLNDWCTKRIDYRIRRKCEAR